MKPSRMLKRLRLDGCGVVPRMSETERVTAMVVHPVAGAGPGRDPDLRLAEAQGLAEALDLDVRHARIDTVRDIRPKAFFGAGKVEQLAELVKAEGVSVVVIDAAITPVQQRNLETALNAKVLDRTGMILEIFGLRARTKEGRLQVELARLAYERSRLVRTWTHLERQRGGRGFLSGPGESQIEADRRIINDKIAKLRRELSQVRRTRTLHRSQRKKAPFPLIALVGYTNAGKSTLFNVLTDAKVLAKDMVFATLDPTLRGVKLRSGVTAMFADTVGFISDLPHDLVEAFQATLEEVQEADLLLHVRDIAHPETDGQAEDVKAILNGLAAGPEQGHAVIEVWNKIDQLSPDDRGITELVARRRGDDDLTDHVGAPVLVSAWTGEGVDDVLNRIDAEVTQGAAVMTFAIAPAEGRAVGWLHDHGHVLGEIVDDDGVRTITARVSSLAAGRFARMFPDVIATRTSVSGHEDAASE